MLFIVQLSKTKCLTLSPWDEKTILPGMDIHIHYLSLTCHQRLRVVAHCTEDEWTEFIHEPRPEKYLLDIRTIPFDISIYRWIDDDESDGLSDECARQVYNLLFVNLQFNSSHP